MEVDKTPSSELYTHCEARLTHAMEISTNLQRENQMQKWPDLICKSVSFIFPNLLLGSYYRQQVPVKLLG